MKKLNRTAYLMAAWMIIATACSSESTKAPNATASCSAPGTTFTGSDGCSTCFCGDNGQVACSTSSCSADMGGADVSGCEVSGSNTAAGETFVGADGCSSCFCGDDGLVSCSSEPCASNNACPPCAAPPSPDCVGSGPCGCGPYTCPDGPDDVLCGDVVCGAGEVCKRAPGCPSGPLSEVCIPIPADCGASPECGCWAEDPCGGGCSSCSTIVDGVLECDCQCRCASPDTAIATPTGERRIADLKVGDLVYSVDEGATVSVPIGRVSKQSVADHQVMRVELVNGTVLEISPGHPTADGRLFSDLRAKDSLDGHVIRSATLVDYTHAYTHDILPTSSTGSYFAAGVLIGSTLSAAAPKAPVACR